MFLATFIIIIIGTTTNSYILTSVENPILPISIGTTYVTTDHNTAYYHINTTIIGKSIKNLETTLKTLKSTLNQTTWSKDYIATLFETNIETSQSRIDDLKKFLKQFSMKKRTKRGILNFVGTVQKWLYGTLDAEDGARYDSYIQTLDENQQTINKNLEDQAQVLRQVTKTFHDQFLTIENNQVLISQRIKNISANNQNLHTILTLNLILDNINMQSNKIRDLINHIQLGINFAQSGVMHYTILQHNELNQILKNIPKNQQIPFDNVIKYYETMSTQVSIQKELIIFTIYTPKINPKPFLMYKLYPIPIQSYTINIKYPYLLLTTDTYFNALYECPNVEGVYLCKFETLTQSEPCVHSIINDEQQTCPFVKIEYEEPTVQTLPNSQILVIPKQSLTAVIQCSQKKYIEIITSPTLISRRKCSVTLSNHTYLEEITENFNLELKIPKINIPDLPENTTTVKLKGVDHEALQEALQEATQLEVRPLKELAFIANNVSTYVIITLIVIVIIILTILYCKRKFRKNNVKTEVQIELPNLVHQPQFATT